MVPNFNEKTIDNDKNYENRFFIDVSHIKGLNGHMLFSKYIRKNDRFLIFREVLHWSKKGYLEKGVRHPPERKKYSPPSNLKKIFCFKF